MKYLCAPEICFSDPELWYSLPLDLKPDNSFPLCCNIMSKGGLEMTNKPESRSLQVARQI